MRIINEQNELISLLKANSIDVIILKGAVAASYYPNPESRAMGDVDFLVRPEDFDRCCELMLANGFNYWQNESFKGYHLTFIKGGIHFEIHRYPAGITESENGQYLNGLINAGFDKIQWKQIGNCRVPCFPEFQNGLVFLLHIEKHLKEGLGLKQILDWMMFVKGYLDDERWNIEFEPVLHKAGLDKLAIAVTRMCQIYLGLDEQSITWCSCADKKLCEQLLGYIFEQGNFGMKKGFSQHGTNVLSRTGGALEFLKSLQVNGCHNWDAVNRHPWLRCFAWAYQIYRYIRLAFSRKHPIKSLIKDFRESKRRKSMLKKLGCYNI